ncbi:MAG: prolyl oligopeptidase family serine peptidase, partial [Janthinobacterium lividum]
GKGGWQDQSSRIQAILDWYGPTDLSTDFRKDYTNPDGLNYIRQYLGDPIAPKLAADASSLQFVTAGLPPFLIEHGDQDPLVPISQSRHFYEKLKAASDDVTLQVVPGAGHGGSQFFTPENIALVDAFFARTLK